MAIEVDYPVLKIGNGVEKSLRNDYRYSKQKPFLHDYLFNHGLLGGPTPRSFQMFLLNGGQRSLALNQRL